MKKGRLKFIALLLLIAAIIGFGAYAYLINQSINNTDPDSGLSKSDGITLASIMQSDYDVNDQTVFGACGGLIVQCTKSGLKWLDKYGAEQQNLVLILDNPILKIAGSKILLANRDGKDIYCIENFKVKWQKTLGDSNDTGNRIVTADINAKGYVTVIQRTDRYKAEITLLDPEGRVVFTRYKGESYVLSAPVSDSGQIMINTDDTSGITIDSTLEFINIDTIEKENGAPFAEITKKDSVFSFISFINGNGVIAAGDDFINCYDGSKKLVWDIKLKKIYSADVAYSKFTVAAVKSQSKKPGNIKTDINTYNDNGSLRSTFSIGEGVLNVKAFETVVATNTGRQAIFTDINGKFLGRYSSKMDITKIEFLDRSNALVITKDTLNVVKL